MMTKMTSLTIEKQPDPDVYLVRGNQYSFALIETEGNDFWVSKQPTDDIQPVGRRVYSTTVPFGEHFWHSCSHQKETPLEGEPGVVPEGIAER